MNKVVYPPQFRGDVYKLVYHIVNTCYPLTQGNRKVLARIVGLYVRGEVGVSAHLNKVLERYDPARQEVFRYQCFTHIETCLAPEDMFYVKSGKKRWVTLREYTFLLQRITKHVCRSAGFQSRMVNRFFLASGLEQTYKKCTGKALDKNKLAHMLQVLQKHLYVHIVYNTKNQRVVQIGPENPFYLLADVPVVEAQSVATRTEKRMDELVRQNTLLQSTVQELRGELAEAREQVRSWEIAMNQWQEEKANMAELLAEREAEVQHLKQARKGGPEQ